MTTVYSGIVTCSAADIPTTNLNVVAAMKAALTAHSNWVVEDEFDAGSIHHVVVRCKSTGSGLPADFRVSISCSATTVALFLGESYNSSTKVLTKVTGAPYNTGSNRTTAADGSWSGASQTLGTSIPATSGAASQAASIQFSGETTFRFTMTVEDDHLRLGVLKATATAWYVGAFESLVPSPATNDPMPLCILQMGGTSVAGYTRKPLQAGTTTVSVGYELCFVTSFSQNNGTTVSIPCWLESPEGIASYLDPVSGVAAASRILLWDLAYGYAQNNYYKTLGMKRGRLKGVRAAGGLPLATLGDTLTIDGVVHSTLMQSAASTGCTFLASTGVAA